MYRQIKDICTCILLYISITCTNGLLCYSCFGYKENALDCKIITCELSLLDDLRTACYYQVFESGYQRRGCENVRSVLSQLIKGNITSYYCREDYCNGYSNVILNDTRRQYKSGETQAPDLKPSLNSTVNVYSSLSWDHEPEDWLYTKVFMLLVIICVIVAIIYLCYFIIKTKCEETSDSFLNINTARYRTSDLEYCGNNRNYYSDLSYNIGRSNYNNYRDDPYIYYDTNCDGGNDFGSGGNDDGVGDRGVSDYGGGDSGGDDCGGRDNGGGDTGGGDSGGGDCGGRDNGGGDTGGGDSGGGDSGGGDD